ADEDLPVAGGGSNDTPLLALEMRRPRGLAYEPETEIRLANPLELVGRDAELEIIFRARPRTAHRPAFAIVGRCNAENETAEWHVRILVDHLKYIARHVVESPGIRGESPHRLQPLAPHADVTLAARVGVIRLSRGRVGAPRIFGVGPTGARR